MSRIESDDLFDIAFIDVVDVLYPDGDYCNRVFDLTYVALYNRITTKEAKFLKCLGKNHAAFPLNISKF